MPNKTELTAFNIDDMFVSGDRFFFQVTYFYNYNVQDESYTNTETKYYNIPVQEINVQQIYDSNIGPISCSINAINKCLLLYTNNMINPQGAYNDPSILYQVVVNQVL